MSPNTGEYEQENGVPVAHGSDVAPSRFSPFRSGLILEKTDRDCHLDIMSRRHH